MPDYSTGLLPHILAAKVGCWPVNLYPVDGERLAGIEGTNRWVGDESMRPDLQSTSVAANPAVALKGRADHDCLAANRDGAADGRVLRPYQSRRSRYREAVRYRHRYLADVVVGDVEEHQT